jgi:hypothetical protein
MRRSGDTAISLEIRATAYSVAAGIRAKREYPRRRKEPAKLPPSGDCMIAAVVIDADGRCANGKPG